MQQKGEKQVIDTKMKLTQDEIDILKGSQGDTMRKVMETLVRYGDASGAEIFVPIEGPVHLVTSVGFVAHHPTVKLYKALAEKGVKTKLPFTVNPRPMDLENIKSTDEEEKSFKMLYCYQEEFEEILKKLGIMDANYYSCTPYVDEVGNIPKRGANLAWAESSAVAYANSVLGARTNRTSGYIDLFSGIIGKTPKFGLLTDEGRKANWVIELRTETIPRPQILGSAIGKKVLDLVPYIKGLSKFLGTELNDKTKDYLKNLGAAAASNGAVGLFHVENITPEAKDIGEKLIRDDAKTYVIDDAELARIVSSYPVLWKNPNANPQIAFFGCPHLSFAELSELAENIEKELKKQGKSKISVRTIALASRSVIDKFKKTDDYPRLMAAGVVLSSICPCWYLSAPPLVGNEAVTNSNKLRTYSHARYVDDADLIRAIVKGGLQ